MHSQTVIKSKSYDSSDTFIGDWLETIPAGVIVIDVAGMIVHYSTLATEMFNLSKNEAWSDVLKRNIKGTSDNGHYILCHSGKYIVMKTQSLPNRRGQLVLLIDESIHKENSESKIKIEKLDSIGKLSATLAHQLRTPLSTAYLYVTNLCLDNVTKADLKVYQDKIAYQLNIIKQQIDDVLLVYKGAESLFETIDLVTEMNFLCDNHKDLNPNMLINVNQHNTNENLTIVGNRQALRGAINNIIENAIHASGKSKSIDINLLLKNKYVVVEVVDYGEGIKEENISKITQGFFTTKEDGNGLGLSIAKSIIEAHQGSLVIESELNRYTKISIILPNLRELRCGQ